MDTNVVVVIVLTAIIGVFLIEYLSFLWIKSQSKGLTRNASLRYLKQEFQTLTGNSRLRRMAYRKGLAIHRLKDNHQVIENARARCASCNREAMCEKWLAGEIEGDGSFCPNAPVFAKLADNRDVDLVA